MQTNDRLLNCIVELIENQWFSRDKFKEDLFIGFRQPVAIPIHESKGILSDPDNTIVILLEGLKKLLAFPAAR
jgi:hypothetical protein